MALPAWFTQFWNASAASPSHPLTLWFLRLVPISLIVLAASVSCVPCALTTSSSSAAIIA
ncbi:hypothetical protein ADK92_16170 [Streptomyces sp. XY533]|nr:hypothetical protein ADK92_16170 [Streptomyces sp. XY533]